MREEDIRPNDLMKMVSKLGTEDIQELLLHKNDFVTISCPACESDEYDFKFNKGEFVFVSCKRCETTYVNPRPTFEMLCEFYRNSKKMKFWNEKIFPASEDNRRYNIFAPRARRVIELCKKYGVNTKVLMDVGAGFGTFCKEMEKTGLFERIIAVEPSSALAQTCRDKGLDIIEKPIEEVYLDDVDVITNFELIEHLYSPREFLVSCNRVLPKGGLLILTTPNIKGFDLLVLGKYANNIGAPNHINYFNPYSLGYLLENIGFEVLEILTPGKLDAELVRKKILDGVYDSSNNPFLEQVLIKEWESMGGAFQQFLADNKLSSHLWIVARKI